MLEKQLIRIVYFKGSMSSARPTLPRRKYRSGICYFVASKWICHGNVYDAGLLGRSSHNTAPQNIMGLSYGELLST